MAASPSPASPTRRARVAPRPAERTPEPRPTLHVVARRRRRKASLVAGFAVVVVLGVLFGLAAFQTVIASDQMELDQLDGSLREQQLRYEQLRLQVAQLESPQRIVSEAARLGLLPPDRVDYLAPSAADVALVAAAAGRAPGFVVPTGAVEQWGSVKRVVEAAP